MKRKRYAWDVAKQASKRRRTRGTFASGPVRTVIQGGNRRQFVTRSYGTPLAVTERKYYDTNLASTAFAAAGATFAGMELDPATANTLFSPVQGDDYNNRQGRKVHVLAIKIRGMITYPVSDNQVAALVTPHLRILLVQDKQTNAAQLNSEDVIQTNMMGFQNPAFFGRFRVIKDKIVNFTDPMRSYDGTNIQQSGDQRFFKMKVKFAKPIIVHYNSTNGGTVADVIDNSFHLIGGSSDTGLAPSIAYRVRTTFVDL